MIAPSSLSNLAMTCPQGSFRDGWTSLKPCDSSSWPACCTAAFAFNLELDADLRRRPIGRPVAGAKARMRRLRQWPNAKMLASVNLLAEVIVVPGLGCFKEVGPGC